MLFAWPFIVHPTVPILAISSRSRFRKMPQTSRGKSNRLQRTAAEFATSALDGCGLRDHLPARPAPYASYPVLVHRLASLLHASFRQSLTTMPLRFTITSPPSECEGDLNPQAVKHARHTKDRPEIPDPAVHKGTPFDTAGSHRSGRVKRCGFKHSAGALDRHR